jgi:hypothetical protein
MNRRKITIIAFLKAMRAHGLYVRTFHTGETVWWDTEQTCDPVVFEADNFALRQSSAIPKKRRISNATSNSRALT